MDGRPRPGMCLPPAGKGCPQQRPESTITPLGTPPDLCRTHHRTPPHTITCPKLMPEKAQTPAATPGHAHVFSRDGSDLLAGCCIRRTLPIPPMDDAPLHISIPFPTKKPPEPITAASPPGRIKSSLPCAPLRNGPRKRERHRARSGRRPVQAALYIYFVPFHVPRLDKQLADGTRTSWHPWLHQMS
jgi:hypothetical protein